MIGRVRRWSASYIDQGRYTPVGVAFHWIMAALVLFQLGWGFYAGLLMPGGDKIAAYQVHSAVGLPILLLAILRVAWRVTIQDPENAADRQGWKSVAAHITHYLFYLCFFGLPLSGWAMWSSLAPPGPLSLGGVLPWPQLPLDELDLATRMAVMDVAEDVHHLLVILLVVLVPLHVGAALKHHFWDRDEVLSAILPEVPDEDLPGGVRHTQPERQFPPAPARG